MAMAEGKVYEPINDFKIPLDPFGCLRHELRPNVANKDVLFKKGEVWAASKIRAAIGSPL
jgi:hypothetical protein